MTAADLGERLLGEVELETLDKVGDDDHECHKRIRRAKSISSSYKHCAIEAIHSRHRSSESRPLTSY